jgi:hypothetical protein
MSDDPVDLIKYVIHNCNMWLAYAEKPKSYKWVDDGTEDGISVYMTIEEQQYNMSYLLTGFAMHDLEKAIQKITYGKHLFSDEEEHF